jgi:hypothetical protein
MQQKRHDPENSSMMLSQSNFRQNTTQYQNLACSMTRGGILRTGGVPHAPDQ